MGNSSSTNVFLSVNDSRSRITAGSTLTGEIRCPDHTVTRDLLAGVTLYFVGKEDVEVRVAESASGNCKDGSRGAGAKYKAAKRYIVRAVIPLDASRRSVESGRYPFEYRIPDHLPSSLYHKDGHGGYCSIRYKVKLRLSRGRDQEIPVEVAARPPPPVPVPSPADPTTARIQLLYCIPQGSVTWAAGVEDTRVGPGEAIRINLGMKNESLAKLEGVTAKLKQTVEWHSSGHSSVDKKVVRSASFGRTEDMAPWSRDQLRLVRRGRKGGGDSRVNELSRTSAPQTVYEEVLDTVQGGINSITFPVPEYVCQSYAGRLIKIHHYVSITARTSTYLTNPKIHIPIDVVSPRQHRTPIVTAQAVPMVPSPSPSAPPFFPPPGAGADACLDMDMMLDDSEHSLPLLTGSIAMGAPVMINDEGGREGEDVFADSLEPGAASTTHAEEVRREHPPQPPEGKGHLVCMH